MEGGGRLLELKGGKLKFKSPRDGKVKFEAGAVGAEKGNPKEVEELQSRLWALSGLGGAGGRGGVSGRERREHSQGWCWERRRRRSDCQGRGARVLSCRREGDGWRGRRGCQD